MGGIWNAVKNFVKNLFTGVGQERFAPGTRVIVHMDGLRMVGHVLEDKRGSRRARVRVQLEKGGEFVFPASNVTVG